MIVPPLKNTHEMSLSTRLTQNLIQNQQKRNLNDVKCIVQRTFVCLFVCVSAPQIHAYIPFGMMNVQSIFKVLSNPKYTHAKVAATITTMCPPLALPKI